MREPTFSFAPTKTYGPISVDLREEVKKIKKFLSLHALFLSLLSVLMPKMAFPPFYLTYYYYYYYYYYFLFLIISFYCIINHVANCEPHIQVHHMALSMCHSLRVPCGIPLAMPCVIRPIEKYAILTVSEFDEFRRGS